MRNLHIAAVLCLLLTATHGLTYYTHNFNTVTTKAPYYNVGFTTGGTTLQINVTLLGVTFMTTPGLVQMFQGANIYRDSDPTTPIPLTRTCTTGQ